MTLFRSALVLMVVMVGPAAIGCAQVERPKHETFESNGVKIAYYVEGKGEPVVLIHGWKSSSAMNWQLPGTVRLLAKDFQVIAIDVRGHGQSDKPEKEEAYGPELVEDIVRLLDHLKIKKAHIVGYSMGGFITAKFLAAHPDRALSGTLAGSGWLREGSVEQKFIAAVGKDGQPANLCFQSVAKLALTEKEAKDISVPVLMIIGDKDDLKKKYVDPLAELHKDWPVVDVKDANHISCVGKTQFKEELAAWLKKNSK